VKQPRTEERHVPGGQLDCTSTLPLPKLDTYKQDYPHLLRRESLLATAYYLFNTTRNPFNDVRVRKAFSLASTANFSVSADVGRARGPPSTLAALTSRLTEKLALTAREKAFSHADIVEGFSGWY